MHFVEEPGPAVASFSNTRGLTLFCSAAQSHTTISGQSSAVHTQWLRRAGRRGSLQPVANVTQLLYVRSVDGALVFPPFSSDQFRPQLHVASYFCAAHSKAALTSNVDSDTIIPAIEQRILSREVQVQAGKFFFALFFFRLNVFLIHSFITE